MTSETVEARTARREDEIQLRELAERYARMMDRMNFDWIPQVFAEDGVLAGPGYEMTGHDQLRQGLQSLDQFSATLGRPVSQQSQYARMLFSKFSKVRPTHDNPVP